MLSPGTRLGTYEVTAHIGSGGMGDVYQAHDSKLDRDVAIKVLPEQFARDSERLGRFQREAKLLAALNHPNIATIHGLEQSGDAHYLVMELVPGDTLRERIAREGALPLDESLAIAKQIAEALEAAHESEKGIIHRDLKPANVKITPEGRVKVLDFGLAKAFAADRNSDDPSNSPTLSVAPTIQGMIMGTAAYMSPEQARGKTVTKATDIFAFGAVLYELLTGKQAFPGEDVPDILAAVVRAEPDWSRLPEATPPSIRTLLRRCLRKDKRQRLGDAGAVRLEIEDALSAPTAGAVPQISGWRNAVSPRVFAAIGIVVLAAGIAIGTWVRGRSAPQEQAGVARLALPLLPGTELTEFGTLAISPDATQIAYAGTRGGVSRLYLRPMDGFEAKPITGTEGATGPFFSPDGRWLGFIAGGKLKKISTSGGVVVTLADAGAAGADWGPDDTIIFRGPENTLLQISGTGGAPRTIATADLSKGEGLPLYPEFLPGGKAILFTSNPGDAASADDKPIEVLTIATSTRKVLIQGGSYARYLLSGHLVFLRSGTLMAAPFDLEQLEVTGPPVSVIEGVRESVTGVGAFSCSRGGTCVYATGGMAGAQRTVALVGRTGATQPLPLPPQSYGHPRFSPAGDKLSFWIERAICDVVVYDMARGAVSRLTLAGDNHDPIWTPDGRRITYISRKPATLGYELFWKAVDGSGTEESLNSTPLRLGANTPLSWSPDGSVLAFVKAGDIWLLPASGERKERPFVESRFAETLPAFSPDGRWLAYVSDESGRREVYVQPYPGPGAKYSISTDGGTEPVWARNGREIYFRNSDQMLVVPVSTQPAFNAARPRLLFAGPFAANPSRVNYDVSPDGQRFVMLNPGEQEQGTSQIMVIQNWFEELKQRVPSATK